MPDIALKDILINARQESFRMQHYYLGVEHLFIGLLDIQGGLTSSLLEAQTIANERLRAHIDALPPEQLAVIAEQIWKLREVARASRLGFAGQFERPHRQGFFDLVFWIVAADELLQKECAVILLFSHFCSRCSLRLHTRLHTKMVATVHLNWGDDSPHSAYLKYSPPHRHRR